ncbi:hypothetical protein H6G76_09005 [Nostoc sp. FACHB-152]|uniref:hypothetical protein n=1 Tax=unclassified Nostoc TaxID=2593658 RepID=UPI001682B057|nr:MULTISPECIES: hypothetical protein [unclassified Nostoc]MBD2447303.1 hypothetical protein [Nostoc sp. FACHB-152]MBD2468096.1 hypothetical protein [Nostoc sp. FACHB-145]
MQLKPSVTKLSCAVLGSSGLAAAFLGFGATNASAQLIIQSTGTLSGTLQLPSFNPNFNNRVTRIDTDSQGVYQRNIGYRNKPNYVPVYQSNYVKVETRTDGSLRYFVDFKGIPVISFNGILNSPALSGGQLQAFTYQGKIPNTSFQGVVQDEFGLTRAFYTGVVTDPKTGQQYQGTFQLNGQGPRYSDRNGGESPTVFDYRSDIPGKPSVTTYQMKNTPLVRLTITVPANATPITPSNNNNSTPTTPVVTTNPTPTPVPSTPVTASVDSGAIATTPTPVPSTPVTASVNSGAIATTPTQPNSGSTFNQVLANTSQSNHPSPSTDSNMEFSSGHSLTTNALNLEVSAVAANICHQNSFNCRPQVTAAKQAIGPRSRVLIR